MAEQPLARRNFLKGKTKPRPELDRLNPEWPTQRVAKLYRKFLEKQPPFYHPAISEEAAPPLAVTASLNSMRDVDWDQSAAVHLLGRTMFGSTYTDINNSTSDSLSNTVNTLLQELETAEPPGDWVNEPPPAWDQLTYDEVQAVMEQYREVYRFWQSSIGNGCGRWEIGG